MQETFDEHEQRFLDSKEAEALFRVTTGPTADFRRFRLLPELRYALQTAAGPRS